MAVTGLTTKELQAHLNALAGTDLVLDGVFGANTLAEAKRYVRTRNTKPSWERDKKAIILATEQTILKHFGLYHGDIDGYDGQLTTDARIAYQAGYWRDTIDSLLPPVLPATMKWPKYSSYEQMCEAFGEPGEKLIRLDLPYPLTLAWAQDTEVSRIAIHELVAQSAYEALVLISEDYTLAERLELGFNLFGGCFNDRPMRGSTKKSTHAWGIAIDFDPLRNQLRWDHKKAKFAKPECDRFWTAWESKGWVSLGRERDYDWMHIQACNL